jgi:glycogen synthase
VRDFVIASREFHPFGGGGIGTYLNALALTLHGTWRVTVITTSAHRSRYDELVASGDDRIPPHTRFVFADDPEQAESYFGWAHAWSARIYTEIKRQFPFGGPDVVEFQDYLGQGAVTCQANAVGDPALANTRVCVRISTTSELCSVLDGRIGSGWPNNLTAEVERLSLRYADFLLWGGGDIIDSYRRYFGPANLSPAIRVRHAMIIDGGTQLGPAGDVDPTSGPLRLLYFGRLERRKGVQNLLRALTGLDDDWQLTLVGADTETAPLGGSMREQLELMAAGDPRISFHDAVARRDVPALIRAHHVTVVPSLWECWPGVALESLACDRPVLATPTGGLTEIVRPGHSGWHTSGNDDYAIAMGIDYLLKHRDEVAELIASDRPMRYASELTDPVQIRDSYASIAESPKRFPAALRTTGAAPLVSVVIPYYRLSRFLEEAVRSIVGQTHPNLEIILVNDGSFWPEDQIVAELAVRYPIRVLTQPNSGLGTARNAGIGQARGKYVFPMDADNIAEPEFVARCVSVLESDPRLAYVTTWSRFIDEAGAPDTQTGVGYQALGNTSRILTYCNAAGDAAAVLPRRLFHIGYRYSADIHTYEDWTLYRELAQDGRFGRVIPERLMRYRIRSDSMVREVGQPRIEHLMQEIDAQTSERRGEWTLLSASR